MTTFTTEDREWAFWHSYDAPKYTKQTEIKFFWPLTEQIDLGLDCSGCDTRDFKGIYLSDGSGATFSTGSGLKLNSTGSAWVSVNTGRLELDVEQTTIIVKKKPALYRRALYKLIGINWRIK
jgi:hypothetical protein